MHDIDLAIWLCGVFVKAALLLAIVWLGSMLMRKRSAAVQHRWWILGFAGCLLIPVVSFITPAWTLPQSPNWMQINRLQTADINPVAQPPIVALGDGKVQPKRLAPPRGVPSKMTPQQKLGTRAITIENSLADSGDSAYVPNDIEIAHPQPVQSQQIFEFPWAKVLCLLWSFGVALVYFRSIWQHWLLHRMLGRCSKLEDADWQSLLGESKQQIGVRTNVELLEHDATHSPLTAGLWRPVVILPTDARKWSRQRRRLVLLHELAHVSRKDVLTQTLAGVGCGLHWFNPLFWYGLRQMRKLRELACDDLVLSCGQPAEGYADVLLDIARSYRHPTYASAVGMAHNNDVESRIMAILDKTKRRVTLSATSARLLLAFAAAILCVVATVQLRTQAQSPALASQEQSSELSNESSETSNALDTWTMKVRILDEDRKPLAGAFLYAGFLYPQDYKGPKAPKEYTADEQGNIQLQLPKKLFLLRLWPNHAGYVGEFKNFEQDEQDRESGNDELDWVPDTFEFQLSKSHSIGGRIVDSKGDPIQGVKVQVRVEDGPPMVSTWLTDSFGQPSIKTDAHGKWKLTTAPGVPDDGADCKFIVKLTHPDYISDEHWGDSQREQGVQATDFRRGTAEIALKAGNSVTGAVVDVDGNPITKGWAVFRDLPYFSNGVWEAELDSDGRYRTPPLANGEHPITIVAPGFAAQRRVVKVGSDSNEQPFKLRPGKRITIKFVDASGASVPQTRVGLATSSVPNTWQNSNALHNHKHSNVPDYGVPRFSDDAGVYVWDWAPEEPVKYTVGAKGFANQAIALVAKTEPHIVTLSAHRVVAGSVTDAVTRKPIEKFSVMPVIVFGPENYCTRFTNLRKGSKGNYELPLRGSGDPSVHYRVHVEAEGYRTMISEESFGPRDGRATLDLRLQPAPMKKGRIINPDGSPVANAKILQGTPTWTPRTENGKPDSDDQRVVESDSDGRFELNATTEPVRIRVIHDTGMAEKLIQPQEESIGDLQLQPWATVSGRLMQNGNPVGNQYIYFRTLAERELKDPRFQDSYSALTAPDGSFTFERLPPAVGCFRPDLGPWRDSPLTSAKSMPLDLKPGVNHEIVLGGEGALITGQVVATGRDEVPLDRKYSLNYLISRDRGVAPSLVDGFPELSFDPLRVGPSTPIQLSWSLDPNFLNWVATRENHFVKLNADGELSVSGVAPGSYDLVISLYEQPAGCLVETVGEKVVAIEVKEGGKVELGRIEVPCRAGPRPGSSMHAFSFVDNTGKEKYVNDMAGSYVLMHVWASWCSPCIERMPEIQQFAESVEFDAVTFVGLNIDKDSDAARELVDKEGWEWAQNYLGDESDMARQLAISSVPTYYLIGPDGKLVVSATKWSEVKQKLEALVKEPTQESAKE